MPPHSGLREFPTPIVARAPHAIQMSDCRTPRCVQEWETPGDRWWGPWRTEGNELVHLGVALGVFCRPYCDTREGWRGAHQFQPGNCHPNGGDSDLRVVRRSFHEEPVHLDHRETNLDISDPVGHCHRLVLAMLFPGLATWGSFEGRSCRQIECGDCDRISCNLSPRATHLASLG